MVNLNEIFFFNFKIFFQIILGHFYRSIYYEMFMQYKGQQMFSNGVNLHLYKYKKMEKGNFHISLTMCIKPSCVY